MSFSSGLSEIDGGDYEYPLSMFSQLEKVVLEHSDRVAVVSTTQDINHLAQLTGNQHQTDTVCLSWSFGALHYATIQMVDRIMYQYTVKPGSTIVSLVPNGVEYPLMLWLSMMGKYRYCPLDPNLVVQSNAKELKGMLDQVQADVILVMDERAAVTVDAQLTYSPKVKIIASDNHTSWVGLSTFGMPEVNANRRAKIEDEARSDDLDRISLVLFTSGTTSGVPKGCPRPVAAWLLDMDNMYLGIETSITDKPMRSSVHTQGFRAIAPVYAWATWGKAGAIVLQHGFEASAMLDAIQNHKISHMIMLPAMVTALRKQLNYQQVDSSSIRAVLVAGDIITQEAYNATVRAFPDAEVSNLYGMTEGQTFFDWPLAGKTIGNAQSIPLHEGILPVGKVCQGTRLRLTDSDNRSVKIGEKGAIHIQQRGCVRRYLNDVKPEDFYTNEQGYWFVTGDVGIVNSEGWVWVLARDKDIIKRGGIPIGPATLETCLDSLLETQTSVIGMPHDDLGQEPFAVVQELNGISKAEAMQFIVDKMGPDYALSGVATLKELGFEDFPLNETGKIMKRDLVPAVEKFRSIT